MHPSKPVLPNQKQFADDTILPSDNTIKEALNIKSIIQLYMEASSQKVNVGKYEIFFINTKLKIEKKIFHIMGYKKGEFP